MHLSCILRSLLIVIRLSILVCTRHHLPDLNVIVTSRLHIYINFKTFECEKSLNQIFSKIKVREEITDDKDDVLVFIKSNKYKPNKTNIHFE